MHFFIYYLISLINCVQNLYKKIKLIGFTGTTLKNILWAATKATIVNQFTGRMHDLEKLDATTLDGLMKSQQVSRLDHISILAQNVTLRWITYVAISTSSFMQESYLLLSCLKVLD